MPVIGEAERSTLARLNHFNHLLNRMHFVLAGLAELNHSAVCEGKYRNSGT